MVREDFQILVYFSRRQNLDMQYFSDVLMFDIR